MSNTTAARYLMPMRTSRHHYTYEEYLHFEHNVARETKHEYVNGDILAMTGGSIDHARIIANVIAELGAQLKGKPCAVFASELKTVIKAANVSTYPDVSVVCGKAELDPVDKKGYTIVNPTLIVEVLSPSTAEFDCGEKLEYYKLIPSLREVMIVDYEEKRVVIWRKGMGGVWRGEEITGAAVRLESIDCEISLEDIYRDPLAS